jgi:hypothetical protein
VIKSNGYWKQDKNGEEIIRGLTMKANSIYKGDLVNDSIDTLLLKNAKMKDLFDNKAMIMDYQQIKLKILFWLTTKVVVHE